MRKTSEDSGPNRPIGIVIAGPTGSGKTDLAIALARELAGEIVSADSRQVYRGLDAATAKPSRGAADAVAYHLIDCVEPEEIYSAGRFRDDSLRLVSQIRSRGRRPIVAGGTGLYIKALLEGLSDLPKADAALRGRIRESLAKDGEGALRRKLEAADPAALSRIPAGNTHRLLRALEVLELTGKPISSFWGRRVGAVPGPWLCLRIDWPAATLREHLEGRCRKMWPALLEEVRGLRARYSGREPGFMSLGYREALSVVADALAERSGFEAFLRGTLAYAKRQRTWFRHQLPATSVEGGPLESMRAQALTLIKGAGSPS